ncbi:MAG TPA: hypothetical protein VES20_14730 [Bryobacteraceae bacterium]|nr:hypothetical protein [Bryobacteraceae bacterium]
MATAGAAPRSHGAQVTPPSVLAQAPAELTAGRLKRLGEGIGKVVYASEHWVVKRERSRNEIISLIIVWKLLRKLERWLPGSFARRLLNAPSRQIRLLKTVLHALLLPIPKGFWYVAHAREMWSVYAGRSTQGETLARQYLQGTALMPQTIEFPPVRVSVGGWPGWLTVSDATERMHCTLLQRLEELAARDDYDAVEQWLDRMLATRQAGWRRGLFSTDAHLKNFGVSGDRVVLIDAGGLTESWPEIEQRIRFEHESGPPHVRLGLKKVFAGRSDLAAQFDERWRETVTIDGIRRHWPAEKLTRSVP